MEINSLIISYNFTEHGYQETYVITLIQTGEYLKLLPTSKAESYRTDNYIQETYAPEYR
jgi:hypothetical protein